MPNSLPNSLVDVNTVSLLKTHFR